MDDYVEIGDYKICVSYDGLYYVYHCEGKTVTPAGLSLTDALIFIGTHMKNRANETAI